MNAYQLSNQFVEEMASVWPVLATMQGIAGHDSEWNDYSPTGAERARSLLRDYRNQARALPAPADAWEENAANFLQDTLERYLLPLETGDYLKDLNIIDSPPQHARMVFDLMDTSTEQGWRDVISRLEAIDGALGSYRALLEEGLRRGQAAARRQVEAVRQQCLVQAGDGSFFNTLLPSLRESAFDGLSGPLQAGVERARAAFSELGDFLASDYLRHAPDADAVGRERYSREVVRFLGTELDLDETYAWGWEQVRQVGRQMERVASQVDAGESLAAVIERLKTDPAHAAPSQERFLELMRERQQQALEDLDGGHFEVPRAIRQVEVKLAPPGGPLGAYYVPPSEDFARVGSIWYSLGDDEIVPLWDQVSTAYHEGFPGHHLQIGTQLSLHQRLSTLQRVEGYSGYAEGWALYTELLMQELGYYEKPEYLLGMLANQMLRACRVVIDIGSHLGLRIPGDAPFHPGQGWSFELAVEMLEKLGGMPADHARSEVTRYLGWPAQAIAYKVGERLVLELRDEMRRRQGRSFSLKAFHAGVLGCGNVALKRLQQVVLATAGAT